MCAAEKRWWLSIINHFRYRTKCRLQTRTRSIGCVAVRTPTTRISAGRVFSLVSTTSIWKNPFRFRWKRKLAWVHFSAYATSVADFNFKHPFQSQDQQKKSTQIHFDTFLLKSKTNLWFYFYSAYLRCLLPFAVLSDTPFYGGHVTNGWIIPSTSTFFYPVAVVSFMSMLGICWFGIVSPPTWYYAFLFIAICIAKFPLNVCWVFDKEWFTFRWVVQWLWRWSATENITQWHRENTCNAGAVRYFPYWRDIARWARTPGKYGNFELRKKEKSDRKSRTRTTFLYVPMRSGPTTLSRKVN